LVDCLAYYTVYTARNIIGIITSSVCNVVYYGIQGVGGWKLYRLVPRGSLPIHFFRRFCCRIYRLATNS